MSSEWVSTTLGAVTEWMSGGTPKKDEPSFWGGDIPWISANSMHGTKYADSDLKLTNAGLINGSRLAPEKSVLLLVRGGALHNRIPVGITTRPVAFNQDVKALIAKKAFIRPLYLLYWLMGNERFLLDSVVEFTGIGAGKLDTRRMQSLEMSLPPIDEQDAVVSVVMAIDDRITLLRETNATLEAIAQALFKSWFVDFDPVRAKAEGRQPVGMDTTTAALFPDSFEESELGLVPKGWDVRGIDETCELGRGSSPRPIQQFMGGDVPWIKIADATASDGMFVFETKEMIIQDGVRNSVKVQPGDLIMSNSASCGITVFVEVDGCIHDGWLYFKNYQYINKNFLFFWLRKIADHLVHIADGSVQKNLNIALVSSQKIICPPADVLQAFEIIAGSLLGRVRENCIQAKTLTQLRDTLLPRLISGQLRLPEAESLVEEMPS